MSNEQTPEQVAPEQQPAAQQNDEVKNLRSEVHRKMDNLYAQNQLMVEQMRAMTTAKAPAQESTDMSDIENLILSDTPKAVKMIKESVRRDVLGELDKKTSQTTVYETKKNAAITQIYQEFPEVSDINHGLVQRAQQLYNELSQDEQASPTVYKTLVYQAAAEMGLRPFSKRPKDDADSFSVGTSSRSSRKTSPETDAMLEFAKLLGADTDDKKVRDSLNSHAKRQNWTEYQ